jgi:hypothetical protein
MLKLCIKPTYFYCLFAICLQKHKNVQYLSEFANAAHESGIQVGVFSTRRDWFNVMTDKITPLRCVCVCVCVCVCLLCVYYMYCIILCIIYYVIYTIGLVQCDDG